MNPAGCQQLPTQRRTQLVHSTPGKRLKQRCTELSTHGAVYEEVGGVAQQDKHQ